MIRTALLSVAAFALASSVAMAAAKSPAGPNGVITSKDRMHTIATSPSQRPPVKYTRQIPPGETAIYDNLAHAYPDGTYFCCYGFTISGASSIIGEQIWLAVSFTPSTDITADRVELGLGYVTGAVNGAKVSINDDAGGLPGSELAAFKVSNMPPFGSCCATASDGNGAHHGAALTAGQQYWLVVSTKKTEGDLWAAWNMNDTEQVNLQNGAANTGGGWQSTAFLPGVAVAVYGH
jgi:hypothetical protein